MPDHLFVLLRENFPVRGNVSKDTREFEKPTFRPGKTPEADGVKTTNFNRAKLKKSSSRVSPKIRS